MKTIALRITAIGFAGLALSGCTFPIMEDRAEVEVQEPAPVSQAAPVSQVRAASAPASQPQPVRNNPWGHQRIGNTAPLDGDEDGGWSG